VRLIAEQDLPARLELDDDLLIEGDNAAVLDALPQDAFDLIYIDPPFNTGVRQVRRTLEVEPMVGGTPGFGGRGYSRREVSRSAGYADEFDDYVGFLSPRLRRARELLAVHGTLYVHLDYREAHYVKVELDRIFGRECFLNELIWAYDYGARTKRRWPAKHDTILVYVRDPSKYWFDSAAVDREPYMAPGLVGPEKAARGKLPTSVWWHTIVPTNGSEKTGYPTQKPEGVVRRIVTASSRPGGWCLDFFAGSGTLGAVCAALGRRFVLVDSNPEAVAIARDRLTSAPDPRRAAGS
jgi:site-specific DNA-methyltransferase (adenine-specific)